MCVDSHSEITIMWSMLAVPNAASDFHANHIIYLQRKRQPHLLDVDESHMRREPFVIDCYTAMTVQIIVTIKNFPMTTAATKLIVTQILMLV